MVDGSLSTEVTCPSCGYKWLWSYGDDGSCPNCQYEPKDNVFFPDNVHTDMAHKEIMGRGYTCQDCGANYNYKFNFCPDCGRQHGKGRKGFPYPTINQKKEKGR